MISFYDALADAFPDIGVLTELDAQVEEEKAATVPNKPRKPEVYKRSVPRSLSLDANALATLGVAFGMHADEIVILLEAAFAESANPLVVNAFKQLFTTTKLCTNVQDKLAENRQQELERWEACEEDHKDFRRLERQRKEAIKNKADRTKAAEEAYRKVWLEFVRKVEERVAAAGGNMKKLSETDAALYSRAKKGTKTRDPFGFLRRQTGDKCIDILQEVKSDLEYKLRERGVKAALKTIRTSKDLAKELDKLDKRSASDLFDAYVRRIGFCKGDDGYLGLDCVAISRVLDIGVRRKLHSAHQWATHLEREAKREDRLSKYGKYYGRETLSQIYAAMHGFDHTDADF